MKMADEHESLRALVRTALRIEDEHAFLRAVVKTVMEHLAQTRTSPSLHDLCAKALKETQEWPHELNEWKEEEGNARKTRL